MEREKFVLMCFNVNGGLEAWEIVKATEEELYDILVEFENKTIGQNMGTHIGVLTKKEIQEIYKEI